MLQFDRASLPDNTDALRSQVREFLLHNPLQNRPNSDFTSGHNPQFSGLLGTQGWIGMTWPKRYGGAERSYFERYVVTEELLAAGAPVSAHWIADRQSGPLLLRFGTEQQRQAYLPRICAGECFFSIGMSEPDAGSDLAAIRTRARRIKGGWQVNGTKLWSTAAHLNHYLIALVRTSDATEQRHAGMSQLIVDLSADDVEVRPIRNMSGKEEFNEIVFRDCFIPDENLVGEEGNGWQQVTSELAYERSGPERFLSTFRVYLELVRLLGKEPTDEQAAEVGDLTAQLMTLRRMSLSVAGMLEQGKLPAVEAALIKELGNNFEKSLLEIARRVRPASVPGHAFEQAFRDSLLLSPAFTLRGGTREILRGVIARGLGLR